MTKTWCRQEEMLAKLRQFEGRTIREAAQALGRCTGHISMLVKKHKLDIVMRETDRLPRDRGPAGRVKVRPEAVTQRLLHEWFDYDAETGIFRWKKAQMGQRNAGEVAGCVKPDGYLTIGFFGRSWNAHRLAWLYVYGKWPGPIIDHVDGNPLNNAIWNLREATARQSVQNRASRGYTYSKKERAFKATIFVNDRTVYLGSFKREEEARSAYLAATVKYFGEFSQVNRGRRRTGAHASTPAASLPGVQ